MKSVLKTGTYGYRGVFTMTKKVVIYGRVSTNKQTVDNQLLELREISKRNDWEIVEEYLDSGYSGSLGRDKRPSFDRLLKDVNRKKFDGILVWIFLVWVDPSKTSYHSFRMSSPKKSTSTSINRDYRQILQQEK